MTFWILTLATAAILSFFLYKALTAKAPQADTETEMSVYKEQLSEIDRDVSRGILAAEDATRLRTDISRRILTLDAKKDETSHNLSSVSSVLIGLSFFVIFVGGAAALYTHLGQPGYGDLAQKDRIANAKTRMDTRPSQDEFWAKMPADVPLNQPDAQFAEMVKKLRETVEKRPNDLEGHAILFRVEFGLGNYRAAAAAKERVMSLAETPSVQDYFDYAESLILSSNGYVSPQAEAALTAILSRDPQHGPALYYSGLMMAQIDRPDVTFRIWQQLLRNGPEDAPWLDPVRQQIPEIAFLAGQNDFELPETGLKGPNAEDINNAATLSEGDRMDMIQGMVSQLSDRLATQGGSPAEWARLINALGVLGDTDQARNIFANAQEVFGADAAALSQITAAAKQIGIVE